MPDPVRVFVSHHHSPEEDEFTAVLDADLDATGADVVTDFFPEDDFELQDGFLQQIRAGLDLKHNLVVVTTPVAITSPWVQRVVAAAYSWKTGWLLNVYLVVMTAVAPRDLPPDWRDVTILDATQSYKSARNRLFKELGLPAVIESTERSIFGEYPTGFRKAAGLTQEELARQAGLSLPGISDLEPGSRRAPSGETVQRLAEALGLSAAEQASLTREVEGTEQLPSEQPGTQGGVIAGPVPPRHETGAETVAFTSHYPPEVPPGVWDRLLVFVSLDTEEAAAQVEAMAAERLQQRRDEYRAAKAQKPAPLKRGVKLFIEPRLAGFHVDPASITTVWTEDVQGYEFRLRAEDATPYQAVNGLITIYEGPLVRYEIPISIFVRGARQPPAGSSHYTSTHETEPRKTFPSYSHKDEQVVRACETVIQSTGDDYLRDVRVLRSGDPWSPKLLEFIDQADIFQLFWSKNAAQSPEVEHEWRHALTLLSTRPGFIKPVYWTPTLYPLPPELNPMHSSRLDSGAIGLPGPSWLSRLIRHGG